MFSIIIWVYHVEPVNFPWHVVFFVFVFQVKSLPSTGRWLYWTGPSILLYLPPSPFAHVRLSP